MAKLKQYYFYYGAILNAILQKNTDATPSLISNSGEIRQEYRVMTNTSKHEYTLLFKSVMVRKNSKRDNYDSWTFAFSDDEIQRLEDYHKNKDMPVLIYLSCLKENLKDCEIAVLNYDEFAKVVNKHNITIGSYKGKNSYLLFYSGSRSGDEAYRFPKNRIEKTFDELTEGNSTLKNDDDMENSENFKPKNSDVSFHQRLRQEGYMIFLDGDRPKYSEDDVLYFETANIKAKGIETDDGFIVLAGSIVNDKCYKRSLKEKNQKIRAKINRKYIENYRTTCDILFPSSTAAGVFIAGYSVSGPATWKNKQGKTLKEINLIEI